MSKIINVDKFEAFIRKAFKVSDEEVSSLYNEDGELTDFSLLDKKDTERVAKLSEDRTNQRNRGFKEGAEKLEKELKEKYDVESDLTGVEFIDFVIETKVQEAVKDTKSNPEEVLKHPDVIKALNQKDKDFVKREKELIKEWQAKLDSKETEINKANLFNKVKAAALAEFKNLRPILPEDAHKADNLISVFTDKLAKYNYQEDEGTFIVLKDDNNPLQNDHGHNVEFNEHIKGLAEQYFDFRAADDRGSPGNKPPAGGTTSKKVRMPKDKDDYVSMMQDNSLTPEERIEIKNLWTSKNK